MAAMGEQLDMELMVDWRGALEQLQGSQEWEQMQRDLQESEGGGDLVAAVMLRALREATQQAQQAQQAAGAEGVGAGGLGAGSVPPGGGAAAAWQLVAAAQQVAWEKLHSGSWHEVGVVWRDAYSLACLLAAAGAMLWAPRCATDSGPSTTAAAPPPPQQPGERQAAVQAGMAAGVAEALRQLDLAAIMGGALFRPAVDAMIGQLQACWQRLAAQQAQQAGEAAGAGGGPSLPEELPAAAHVAPGSIAQQPQHAQQQAGEGVARADPGADIPLPPGSLGPRGTPVPLEDLPSLECFWREYMHREGGSIPVIIDGAMQNWPALAKWRDMHYLCGVAGPRTVPVEVGEHYLADQWGQKLMTLQDFIDRHIMRERERTSTARGSGSGSGDTSAAPAAAAAAPGRGGAAGGGAAGAGGGGEAAGGDTVAALSAAPAGRGYLAQHPLFEQIPALAGDIREPDYCVLGEGEVQSVNAWFGPAGTVTPLHTDPHHNLLCQAVGRKYVRLYRPQDTHAMYPFSEGLTTNSSQVDLDAPDPQRFPALAPAPFRDCVLAPGQMLYIPPGWWHYVKALDTSFSVSYWWK